MKLPKIVKQSNLGGWINKRHQKFHFFKCTVILFGIVFELRTLGMDGDGDGRYLTIASIFFLVIIYCYPIIKMEKITGTVLLLKSNYTKFSFNVCFL